jgi:hypothetical protein
MIARTAPRPRVHPAEVGLVMLFALALAVSGLAWWADDRRRDRPMDDDPRKPVPPTEAARLQAILARDRLDREPQPKGPDWRVRYPAIAGRIAGRGTRR